MHHYFGHTISVRVEDSEITHGVRAIIERDGDPILVTGVYPLRDKALDAAYVLIDEMIIKRGWLCEEAEKPNTRNEELEAEIAKLQNLLARVLRGVFTGSLPTQLIEAIQDALRKHYQ